MIAPTQLIPAVVGDRRLVTLRWGLVPPWASSLTAIGNTFNARAETAAEKPVFRAAMERRRCLVPASGYYEWTGPRRPRQPWYITAAGGEELALAGLFERWHGCSGLDSVARSVETCTILTTTAARDTEHLHDRSPVLLSRADWERWLDPAVRAAEVADLLRPPAAGRLTAVAVQPLDGTSRLPGPLPEPREESAAATLW